MIADKETTCKPKRTRPTISFRLILYDVGIEMKFYNATAIHIVPLIGLSCLDIMRIRQLFAGEALRISLVKTSKELIRMPEECMQAP